ncbi:MAG: hypothetical protein EOM04_08560 [Clostridia bacterium]|nr:hypothetical protein [Clostridia bacterium]
MLHVSKINFRSLYKIAQYLTLLMLLIIPAQIIIYIAFPPPNTVQGFYNLFHENTLLGLLSLDLLYLFNNIIVLIIYFSLSTILFEEKPVIVSLALILGGIGVACYYPSNPAFEFINLSNSYFLAEPEAKMLFLSAGEALLAGYTGTSFNVYYVLSTISLLLFSFAIIKSSEFSKFTGYAGFTSGFFMIIPSTAGEIGLIFSFLSLIPWIVFITLLMIYFKKRGSILI